jgi:hypothetical protein
MGLSPSLRRFVGTLLVYRTIEISGNLAVWRHFARGPRLNLGSPLLGDYDVQWENGPHAL